MRGIFRLVVCTVLYCVVINSFFPSLFDVPVLGVEVHRSSPGSVLRVLYSIFHYIHANACEYRKFSVYNSVSGAIICRAGQGQVHGTVSCSPLCQEIKVAYS